MTPIESIISKAKSFNGQRNSIVDLYNTHKPYARGYKVKYEDLLCATYVSALFISLGWTDIVPPECAAFRLYRNMDAIGRAFWGNNRTPNPGDLIFFGPWGRTDDKIDHVGIVEKVVGDTITFWDIRYIVAQKTCKVGSKFIKDYGYILGYGMPDYSSKGDISEPVVEEPEFKAGDLVRVKPGATWYKGNSIKQSVFETSWYLIQVKGDRAVLGMDISERSNIQSPINVKYLEHVFPVSNEPEAPAEPAKISVTAIILQETSDKLNALAAQTGMDIGAIIDSVIKELK